METKKELDISKKNIIKENISCECIDVDIDEIAFEKRSADVKGFLGQLFNTFEIGRNTVKDKKR